MKNNKKGFTLIELLAVIVVLAILMLTAGTSVFNLIADARKNNFRNEFLSFIEAASLQAQMDMMNTGTYTTHCYYLTNNESPTNTAPTGTAYTYSSLNTRWDNKGNYYGSIKVTQNASGELEFEANLYSTQFRIEKETAKVKTENVYLLGETNPAAKIPAVASRLKCGATT